MRMMLIALAAAVAGCASPGEPTQRQANNERALTDARPVGEAEDCLQLTNIRETRVRSDQVIDFYTAGGRIYRNTLPQSCPSLGFEERFSYSTSLSRLCSLDTITVLQSPNVSRGATCGLGKFQPIELPDR